MAHIMKTCRVPKGGPVLRNALSLGPRALKSLNGGFPELGVPFLGIPLIRTILY